MATNPDLTEEHFLRLEEVEMKRYVFRDELLYRWAAIGGLPETTVDAQTAETLDELRGWQLLSSGDGGTLALTVAGGQLLGEWVAR